MTDRLISTDYRSIHTRNSVVRSALLSVVTESSGVACHLERNLMADIAYWHEEYTKEANQFASLSTTLNSLIVSNSTNSRKIIKLISECDVIIVKIKDVRASYNCELKLVKDRAEKQDYDKQKKSLDEKVKFLTKKTP